MATRKKSDSSNGDNTPKRTTTKKSAAASNVAVMPQVNLEEEVRRRAYEIYEERGGKHGLDQDDWYRAEQEVMARYGRRSA